MFIVPEGEDNPKERAQALKWTKYGMIVGLLMSLLMLAFWIMPYLKSRYDDYMAECGGIKCAIAEEFEI